MKTVTENVCGFDEVFNFAGTEFGIGWNACNDLFFDVVLDYGGRNTIDLSECADSKDVDHKQEPLNNPGKWDYNTRRAVAEKILYHFMKRHGVKRMVVDSA